MFARSMLFNYLKVALRTLRRNRLLSFINIFGLGLSMSVGLMVFIRLQDALSYDRFHPKEDRIYRILSGYHKKNGENWQMASTPIPLAGSLQKDTSMLESTVMLVPGFSGRTITGNRELPLQAAFTSNAFFTVFGFSLESGNPSEALAQPGSIVLTHDAANKFFGAANPMGKLMLTERGESFLVTGILQPPPGKSHLDYEAYISLSSIPGLKDPSFAKKSEDWFAFNASYNYVLLKPGHSVQELQVSLTSVAATLNQQNKDGVASFKTQALSSITPGSELLYNDKSGSSWMKFYFELGVALIILLSACFNYTNLTTARALTRAREVGVRKVSGASRAQVFTQYLIESIVLSFLALLFAWSLMAFIVHYAPFNDGYEFVPSSFRYNWTLFGWSVAFALFTGLLAGAAPAAILSSFKPVQVLKNLSTARIFGKVSLQKTLIVFQYSLSLFIIIFLVGFYRQFNFMAKADPGFRRDHVVVVPINGLDESLLVPQLSRLNGVRSVAALSGFIGGDHGASLPAWISNKADAITLQYFYADTGFVNTMGLQVLAGNAFRGISDGAAEKYVLLNEAASTAFGFKKPADAIGQQVWVNDSLRLQVTAVFRNYHFENAGIPFRPLALRNRQHAYTHLYIRTDAADRKWVLSQVTQVLRTVTPRDLPQPEWLDETLDRMNAQTATISLLGYIAFMAIAIATLGLAGLVIYTVETRKKQISIRKILGASRETIVRLLSAGFVRLLLIAGLIGVPLGYTAVVLFLQNFAMRANIGIGLAIGCFLFLLLVGLSVILSQTWRAASANPARDLRAE